ncbi:hypothetical protein [Rhodococcoides yunnanense]|uniref:hypothetical protein n=1 Tax=Rhodococcoides yunnanense TaxID=278209 RepID=UPI001FE84A54|nr:hypothetical protein [Rhodococcus yunnanensis]
MNESPIVTSVAPPVGAAPAVGAVRSRADPVIARAQASKDRIRAILIEASNFLFTELKSKLL